MSNGDNTPMAGFEHMRTDEPAAPAPAPAPAARRIVEDGYAFPDPDPLGLGTPANVQRRAAAERAAAAASDAFFSRTGMLLEHAEAEVRRARGIGARESANTTSKPDLVTRGVPAVVEADAPIAPKPVTPGELAHLDPWDEGYVAPEAEGVDGFDRYRLARGHEITPSSVLMNDTRHTLEEISAAARDVGVAAMHSNIPADTANALFGLVADGFSPPPEGEFTIDGCLSELRVLAGADTDKLVESAQRYTANKPALRSWLEESSMGSHPRVVALLGLLDQHPELGTRAGAEQFLSQLKTNAKTRGAYLGGHKVTVLAASLAHAVAASKGKR